MPSENGNVLTGETKQARIVHDDPSPEFDYRRLNEAATMASRQGERTMKLLVTTLIALDERVKQLESRECQCKV